MGIFKRGKGNRAGLCGTEFIRTLSKACPVDYISNSNMQTTFIADNNAQIAYLIVARFFYMDRCVTNS